MAEVRIRELVDADGAFLREMLYAALCWKHPSRFRLLRPLLLAHPKLAMYHRAWGRRGDAGLVATIDGRRAGAVWYRFFTADHHGDGYVDRRTPDLAIAVAEPHRGRGIGRALMETIHAHARQRGIQRLSLSVAADNPAKRLYASLGYEEYVPGDRKGRMIIDLTDASR